MPKKNKIMQHFCCEYILGALLFSGIGHSPGEAAHRLIWKKQTNTSEGYFFKIIIIIIWTVFFLIFFFVWIERKRLEGKCEQTANRFRDYRRGEMRRHCRACKSWHSKRPSSPFLWDHRPPLVPYSLLSASLPLLPPMSPWP